MLFRPAAKKEKPCTAKNSVPPRKECLGARAKKPEKRIGNDPFWGAPGKILRGESDEREGFEGGEGKQNSKNNSKERGIRSHGPSRSRGKGRNLRKGITPTKKKRDPLAGKVFTKGRKKTARKKTDLK